MTISNMFSICNYNHIQMIFQKLSGFILGFSSLLEFIIQHHILQPRQFSHSIQTQKVGLDPGYLMVCMLVMGLAQHKVELVVKKNVIYILTEKQGQGWASTSQSVVIQENYLFFIYFYFFNLAPQYILRSFHFYIIQFHSCSSFLCSDWLYFKFCVSAKSL